MEKTRTRRMSTRIMRLCMAKTQLQIRQRRRGWESTWDCSRRSMTWSQLSTSTSPRLFLRKSNKAKTQDNCLLRYSPLRSFFSPSSKCLTQWRHLCSQTTLPHIIIRQRTNLSLMTFLKEKRKWCLRLRKNKCPPEKTQFNMLKEMKSNRRSRWGMKRTKRGRDPRRGGINSKTVITSFSLIIFIAYNSSKLEELFPVRDSFQMWLYYLLSLIALIVFIH